MRVGVTFVEAQPDCEDDRVGSADENKKSSGWTSRARWLRRSVGPWQPLTGRGVATFRFATWGRLFVFQVLTAVLSALIMGWAVRRTWFPVVARGITRLPEVAEISGGNLKWPDQQPVRLAENVWLDWLVTPTNQTDLGQTADLQVEFRPGELRVNGLAGHLTIPYQNNFTLSLGRIEATARWGAWSSVLLKGLEVAAAVGLLVLWWILATCYTLPALILAVLLGRRARILGAWRISSAALIPGALFGDWAVIAYGIGAVRLPGFLILFALHLVVGWAWLIWGLAHCPQAGSREPENPFLRRGKT